MTEYQEPTENPIPTEVQPAAPSRSRFKKIAIIFLVLMLIGAGAAFYLYNLMTGNQLVAREKSVQIAIPTDITTIDQLADLLAEGNIISSKFGFKLTAWWMDYQIKHGKCKLDKSINSHKDLIHQLSKAKQNIDVTFHNIRTKEELAGRLAKQLNIDSMQFIALFTDVNALREYGVTDTTVMSLFIPDTYEVYANTTAPDLLKRMAKESERFWAAEGRLEKAKALNLTPTQVYTLASIVETETQNVAERPTIAGVYLNRLRDGWKLEADPTVVFAVGDFTIRRVLRSHLETDSPYNTYKYAGLPPGPIYMASKTSIDAVLSPEKHEYMFFCAKPGGEGVHAFAKSLSGHMTNARLYQQWLNQQKVYK